MTVSPPKDTTTDIGPHPSNNEGSITSSKPLPSVNTLFLWDFDWTIVDCNSDEYVPSQFLGDAETNRRLRDLIETHGPAKWHDCVASLVNACMERCEGGREKCSKSDICEAAANMPYLADVKGALEDVSKDDTCGQAIVSDGNDVFIGAFLKENGMEDWFTHGIETNFGRWEKKRENSSDGDGDVEDVLFSVVHQSTKYGGHSSSCPPNLCKSQVLRESLLPNTSRIDIESPLEEDGGSNTKRRPRIVYVGDGSNDACPALHVLNEDDVLLARNGKRISNPNNKIGSQEDANPDELTESNEGSSFPILSVLKKAKEKRGLVPKCRVYAWNSGKELRALVRSLLDET